MVPKKPSPSKNPKGGKRENKKPGCPKNAKRKTGNKRGKNPQIHVLYLRIANPNQGESMSEPNQKMDEVDQRQQGEIETIVLYMTELAEEQGLLQQALATIISKIQGLQDQLGLVKEKFAQHDGKFAHYDEERTGTIEALGRLRDVIAENKARRSTTAAANSNKPVV